MEIIEERTIGPSLGAENIQKGFDSVTWGFLVVAGFMCVYYMLFGVISSIALAFNLLLLVAVLSMLQATLTLPGMAAMALVLGMAIDANVLINERVREELRSGAAPQAAIHAGYDRAWSTILDSNVTTLIAGIALLAFGSGPVRRLRGGARARHPDQHVLVRVLLARTRQLLVWAQEEAQDGFDRHGLEAGRNRGGRCAARITAPRRLNAQGEESLMEFFKIRRDIPFMRHALVFNVISFATFALAVFFLFSRGLHLSVEFTGGTVMQVSYSQPADLEKLRAQVGTLGYSDVQIQSFGNSRDVLIRLPVKQGETSAQQSERVIGALRTVDASARLDRVEFVGPQVGDELAANGLKALAFVVVGIMLYLAMRFEWKFAVAGIIANLHDVVIILGLLRILPVGVLAAGAGRGARGARLLG